MLTVGQFVGHGGGPLEGQSQDSHVYRKTDILPLIFFGKIRVVTTSMKMSKKLRKRYGILDV